MNKKSEIRNPKSEIVLVHGAFRGGWAWQKVRRILQSAGLEVFAPCLTGAGEKAHLLSPEITLETWTKDIVNLCESEDLNRISLVGHSQGGIVIQAVAEQIPERISRLIFLDAPVLRDGEAAVDVIPPEIHARFGENLPDSLIEPFPLKPGEFSVEETAWINKRLTAVPTNPSLQKISLKNRQAAEIPHTYIFCTETPPFFPASFTRQRFDRENVPYLLIEAGHDCILSKPAEVAEILQNIFA